jgi:hypothetical protein
LIAIPRALAGLFRAVVRKSVMAADPRGPTPLVLLQAGSAGLTLSCGQADVAVRHHSTGGRPAAKLALPLSALQTFEGRGDGLVVLEAIGPFKLKASWSDGVASRDAEFDTATADSARAEPQSADNTVEMPAGFLAALAEAGRTTSKEAGRYNLSRVMLRGSDGAVVATDGKQLLIQSGFSLPWAEDRLVPRLPVFEGRELPADQPVRVGLADEHLTLEVGPWLLCVKAEQAQRYPDVSAVIPRVRDVKGRLRIHPEDAPELLQALPHLPGAGEQHSPITLDAADRVVVRARGKEGPAVEVVLGRSTREGSPMRVSCNRLHLIRALRLGLGEIAFAGDGRPLLCRTGTIAFCWMPLDTASVVPPAETESPTVSADPEPVSSLAPDPERRSSDMPPTGNGIHTDPRNRSTPTPEPPDVLAEAEAIRTQLQEALGRTARLIAALRQDRRRNRAVRTAVASLRRLEDRGGQPPR